MRVQIRPEQPRDVAAIDSVITAAFRDDPQSSHTEQVIVGALRRAGALSVSLVAVDEDTVVGHVALSPVTVSSGATGLYGLGPLSVAPARQGEGIGSRLVEHAFARLRGFGAAGCVVLGDPAYYARFGFTAEPSLVLPGVPPQYFQAIAFDGPIPVGDVSYHEAFDAEG